MPSRSSGTDSSLRTTKAETRSARRGVDPEATGGRSLSGDLAAFEELQDLRALLRHRHQRVRIRTRVQNALQSKCPREWPTTRHRPVALVPVLERRGRACYFQMSARSGGTGRRAGLKIQWYLVPCGFDPLLRDHFHFRNIELPALRFSYFPAKIDFQ